jgi:hypothetical protein
VSKISAHCPVPFAALCFLFGSVRCFLLSAPYSLLGSVCCFARCLLIAVCCSLLSARFCSRLSALGSLLLCSLLGSAFCLLLEALTSLLLSCLLSRASKTCGSRRTLRFRRICLLRRTSLRPTSFFMQLPTSRLPLISILWLVTYSSDRSNGNTMLDSNSPVPRNGNSSQRGFSRLASQT